MVLHHSQLEFGAVTAQPPLQLNPEAAQASPAVYKAPSVCYIDNLSQLLSRAATTSGCCVFYSAREGGELQSQRVSYAELLAEALGKASCIASIQDLAPDSVLLLHCDSQQDVIVWFWAVILAGYLPAISTPLVNDDGQRKTHLAHLHALLRNPTVITTQRLAAEFQGVPQLTVRHVESLAGAVTPVPLPNPARLPAMSPSSC